MNDTGEDDKGFWSDYAMRISNEKKRLINGAETKGP
jgi:hypothetical protein